METHLRARRPLRAQTGETLREEAPTEDQKASEGGARQWSKQKEAGCTPTHLLSSSAPSSVSALLGSPLSLAETLSEVRGRGDGNETLLFLRLSGSIITPPEERLQLA